MSKLKYVTSGPDRHGKLRHRYRRNGISLYLPGVPGSDEFNAAYQEAVRRSQEALKAPPARHLSAEEVRCPKGSVAALIRDYKETTRYQRLAAPTVRQYEGAFAAFIEKFGTAAVRHIKTKHVLAMMDGLKATPGVANAYLRTLKMLLNYAVLRGDIAFNPAGNVRQIKLGEWVAWSEDDVRRFEKRWPLGTIERRIYNVALCTGQRAEDLRRMRVDDIDDGWIRVRQGKTGELVELPVQASLQRDLEAFPPKGEFLISRPDGKPYGPGSLSKLVKAALREAGIDEDRKLHGLRKATCRRLAEAGCSEREIMSVSGHRSSASVSGYVRQVNQRHMAQQAMARITLSNQEMPNH